MLDLKALLTKILSKTIVENSANHYIQIGNFAMCWGYADIPAMSASGYTYVNVTFPITFSTAPHVVPFFSAGYGAGRMIMIQAIHSAQTTTTGQMFVYNYAGGATGISTKGAGWVAIGFSNGGGVFNLQTLRNMFTPRKVVGAC